MPASAPPTAVSAFPGRALHLTERDKGIAQWPCNSRGAPGWASTISSLPSARGPAPTAAVGDVIRAIGRLFDGGCDWGGLVSWAITDAEQPTLSAASPGPARRPQTVRPLSFGLSLA